MMLHQPRFRHPEKAVLPPNLAEAEHLAPGVTPLYANLDDLAVDVETPEGAVVALDSPELHASFARRRSGKADDCEVRRAPDRLPASVPDLDPDG